jgi:hypothetical protein
VVAQAAYPDDRKSGKWTSRRQKHRTVEDVTRFALATEFHDGHKFGKANAVLENEAASFRFERIDACVEFLNATRQMRFLLRQNKQIACGQGH